jgi:hypothetical protein
LKRSKQLCGADLSTSIDWSGMTAEMIKSGDILHCEHALDVIERICQDRPGQDAVRAQVKSVVCGYDAKRSIRLKGGALEFKSDFMSGDDVRVMKAAKRLAGAKRLAACRTQSGDRFAFHQDRTGVAKVVAFRRFVCDLLYDSRPKCVPAPFGEFARGFGLTPIRRLL